jgi:1-acyl-sn-glycerol-3-phosphate acyltransferase
MKLLKKRLVNGVIRFILHVLLKLDLSELKKIPPDGALVVAVNHVNFLDAPVMITHLQPHRTTGLIKKQTWENPVMAFLFNVWDGIPIDREIADFEAFRRAKEALKKDKILAIAPEGTRTEDGLLIQAKPGVAILALQTGVPIYPVAYYGHEDFKKNLKRLKRTEMNIRVGKPFIVDLQGQPKTKENLQSIANSIMLEIAALLPKPYRGYYSDKMAQRGRFLTYLESAPRKQIAQSFGEQFPQSEVSSSPIGD